MEKYLLLAGIMIASAVAVPKILEPKLEGDTAAPAQQVSAPAQRVEPVKKRTHNPLEGRIERVAMDSRGHFVVEARMNGRKSKVLVDTGATYVAINESTARKLGIRLKDADFKHKVRTANGITFAAAAMIDDIQIGRVRVENVPASVSRDESLGTTLLGMSFLKKLSKFEISSGELVLTQ